MAQQICKSTSGGPGPLLVAHSHLELQSHGIIHSLLGSVATRHT